MPVAPSCQSGCHAHEVAGRIRRGLEPALERKQVDAAVTVDISRANPVSGRRCAQVVLFELDPETPILLHHLVPDDHVDRVGQEIGHAVTREIDHPRCLDVSGDVDFVIHPGRAGFARDFRPIPRFVQNTNT